jgi:hypothetical protein
MKQKLIYYSRIIAQSIQELVQCAEQLKGKISRDTNRNHFYLNNRHRFY